MQLVEKEHHAYGRSTCFGWQRVTLSAHQVWSNPRCCGNELHSRNDTALLLLSELMVKLVVWSCLEFFGLAKILIRTAWFSYINFTSSIGDWNQISIISHTQNSAIGELKKVSQQATLLFVDPILSIMGRPNLNVDLAVKKKKSSRLYAIKI